MAKYPIHTTGVHTAVYPHLHREDPEYGDYKVTFRLTEEEAQEFIKVHDSMMPAARDMWNGKGKQVDFAGSPVRPEEDEDEELTGMWLVTFKVKAKGENRRTGETWDNTPDMVDASGKRIEGERPRVGGGSKVAVAYQAYPWYGTSKTVKGAGVSFRLKAVQIVELVEFGGSGGAFGVVEGGYVAPEAPAGNSSGFADRSEESGSTMDPDF